MANETVLAGNPDTLAITGEDKLFYNSGDMRLILTGLQLTVSTPSKPAPDNLAITGEVPTRGVGLLTTGQQPVVRIDEIVPAIIGTIQLSSTEPQVFGEPPAKVAPDGTKALSLVGLAPDVGNLLAVTGSISLSGLTPVAAVSGDIIIPPKRDKTGEEFGDITENAIFNGKTPTLSYAFVGGQPGDGTLIQGEAVGDGTFWESEVDIPGSPTTDTPHRYNICARSGFKQKPGTLIKDGYGEMVRPESAEPRHMQERVKSQPESQRGALRPEPIGDETFIDSDDPILPEDL